MIVDNMTTDQSWVRDIDNSLMPTLVAKVEDSHRGAADQEYYCQNKCMVELGALLKIVLQACQSAAMIEPPLTALASLILSCLESRQVHSVN